MCNFSGMIKNVLPSLRQRAGPQRICSRQKSIHSGTARDSFSQTPHMRGKDPDIVLLRGIAGITPAYAGKRWYTRCAKKLPQDHPRTCGEKARTLIVQDEPQGSPPRMRGKVRAIVDAALEGGITPAHAGKRACTTTGTTRRKDHPRVCGEKTWLQLYAIARQGSPPHVRGKGAPGNVSGAHNGITPACAGKRLLYWKNT